jgi:hypothetical protein
VEALPDNEQNDQGDNQNKDTTAQADHRVTKSMVFLYKGERERERERERKMRRGTAVCFLSIARSSLFPLSIVSLVLFFLFSLFSLGISLTNFSLSLLLFSISF